MSRRRELDLLDSSRARLHEVREELTRADSKISTALAAEGVIAGVVVAAMIAGNWSPLTLPSCAPILWWLGAALWLISLWALGDGIYPRTKRKGRPVSGIAAYYGDPHPDGGANHGRYGFIALELQRVEDQVAQVGWIVRRKYSSIQRGLWAVALGSLLLLASALWDLFA